MFGQEQDSLCIYTWVVDTLILHLLFSFSLLLKILLLLLVTTTSKTFLFFLFFLSVKSTPQKENTTFLPLTALLLLSSMERKTESCEVRHRQRLIESLQTSLLMF